MGKVFQSSGESAEQMATKLQTSIDAMAEFANQQLKMSGSAIGLEAAIDDATAAVQKNGATYDINTAAGRANMTALNGVASSALSLRDAQMKAGESAETMNASTQRARDAFVSTAVQMGYTKEEANRLADSYKLIPTEVVTHVSVPGANASKEDVDRFHAALDALPPEKQSEIKALIDQGKIAEAEAALNNAARDRSASISVSVGISYNDALGIGRNIASELGIGHSAAGGMITGPGTGTSDSILMMLSNGEFVQRARAVDYYGPAFMHALNSLSIPKSQLPHFAHGGEVTPRFNTVDRTGGYRAAASPVVAPVIQQVSPQAIAQAVAAALPAALHGATLTLTPDGRTAMAGFIGTQVAGVAAAAAGSRYR